MKIILSRKGFDDKFGGGPSPILDGKQLVSLPIENGKWETKRRFNDVRWNGKNLGLLLEQLHPKRKRDEFCHLDPDLRADALPGRANLKTWRPLFGQAGAAASHLLANISQNDLFLFFGYFRESRGWQQFVPTAAKLHVVFGWLQVDEIVLEPAAWAKKKENRWAALHPHTYIQFPNPNVIFVAKRRLVDAKGLTTSLPGAGLFQRFDHRLQLTAPNASRSIWRLPIALCPDAQRGRHISYLDKCKWSKSRDGQFVDMDPGNTRLWQEAVISGNPDAVQWAIKLVEDLSRRK
ncbi:MAG: hypothetical protein AB7O59_04355 [Pirellulales bacterium]